MATFLLSRGADVAMVDDAGQSCLHYAAMNENREVMLFIRSTRYELSALCYYV